MATIDIAFSQSDKIEVSDAKTLERLDAECLSIEYDRRLEDYVCTLVKRSSEPLEFGSNKLRMICNALENLYQIGPADDIWSVKHE